MNLVDIGGGFPAPYDATVKPVPGTGQGDQHRTRPPLPKGYPDSRRAGPLHGGHRRHCRVEGHRQGGPRRQELLLHQRRGLSHVFRHHLRPLQIPYQAFKRGPTQTLLRLRSDLRRPRRGLHGGKSPRTRTRRLCSTARTSAPTATPRRRTSTGFRPRRSCTSTSRFRRRRNLDSSRRATPRRSHAFRPRSATNAPTTTNAPPPT